MPDPFNIGMSDARPVRGLAALMQTWPARAAQSGLAALMAPGDAYAGNFSRAPQSPGSWSDEDEAAQQIASRQMGERAVDLAGLVMGGGYASPALENASGMGIRAYHASPADFKKFDITKIGTGEGRFYPDRIGEHGLGLYFTDSPAIAEQYRGMLREELGARKKYGGMPQAHVYEADLRVNPSQLLDFSKSAASSPEAAKLARELGLNPKKTTGQDIFNAAGNTGKSIDPEIATMLLKDAGYKGTSYLDDAGRNYVMFDASLIDILRKYGLAGLSASPLAAFMSSGDAQASTQK